MVQKVNMRIICFNIVYATSETSKFHQRKDEYITSKLFDMLMVYLYLLKYGVAKINIEFL